jgi:hypothetical protein
MPPNCLREAAVSCDHAQALLNAEPQACETSHTGDAGLRSVAHRRVGHYLVQLLSTAAGDGDLGSPLQRVLA